MATGLVGETIHHYTFLEELGTGGMGIVYKARDLRLNRFVAVKVLHPDKSADAERRRRFVQEARAASALNHPNIVTIYETNRHEQMDYIVMEFVEGTTLDALIPPKGLSLGEVLRYAVQIADALSAAHAAGIVHRDLKPGNVMVSPTGRVKVLDFGLAKLMDTSAVGDESSNTLTMAFRYANLTGDRNIVGTVSYMSPEQAEGRPVDARSDIFSFGALLYEMVTGRRAFQADSAAGTMASVLRDEPVPVTQAAPAAPTELGRIVHRCLRKEPARRVQHIDDLLLELEDLKQQTDSGNLQPLTSRVRRPLALKQRWPFLAIAALCGLLGWLIGWWSAPREAEDDQILSLVRFAGGSGQAISPAWSPTGDWVVFASDQDGTLDLWKQPTAGGEAVRLTGPPHREWSPSWSPDGRSIAFATDAEGGGIFLIPADGGSATRLTAFGSRPVWSPDGQAIAFEWQGDIFRTPVPSNGAEPVLVAGGTGGTPFVTWSPDGKLLAFWHEVKVDLFVVPAAGGEPRPLGLVPTGEEIAGLSWSADGKSLVYSQGPFGGNKDLWRVPVDPHSGSPVAKPRRLTLSATDDAECVFSPDGSTIAYGVHRMERHLWQVERDPLTGDTRGTPRRLTENGQMNYYPAISPDGRVLVWTSHASGRGQLYYRELPRGATKKLTSDWNSSIREIFASFAADSRELLYTSTLNGSYQIWRLPAIGGVSLRISDSLDPARDVAPVLSPDGKTIAFYGNKAGNWDIWLMETGNGSTPRQLTDWPSNDTYPVFSPDGTKLAFLSDREGSPDVWVYHFATKEFERVIDGPSQEGWFAWSPDSRYVYFTSNRSGEFQLWMRESQGGDARTVDLHAGSSLRMPQSNKLYTKFVVTPNSIVTPLESLRSEIYLLQFRKRQQ